MIVEFTIPGPCVGKGRPKFTRRPGFVQTYTPKRTKDYEKQVVIAYNKVARGKKLSGPVKAEISAIYEPPKSVSKKVRNQMLSGELPYTKKPDADNAVKSVLDALNTIAYDDDSSINELYFNKQYGEEAMTKVRLSDNKIAAQPLVFFNSEGGAIEDP